MKKHLPLVVAVLLSLPLTVSAQLRLSILGGPHSANVVETNSIPGWDSTIKPGYQNRSGFHVGFLVNIPLGDSRRFSLNPAFIYMSKGRKFYHRNDSTGIADTDTISFSSTFFPNYIEVPLNLSYRLPIGKKSHFLVSAGPYVAFFYKGKHHTETTIYSTNKFVQRDEQIETGKTIGKVKTTDIGFNTRIGFELGKVYITGYYSQGLTNFYQAAYGGTFKHRIVGASLGIWLNNAALVSTKPKDHDKDGVPDKEDQCPELPGLPLTGGCPDIDGDGVADKLDNCPGVAGLVKYNGCPIPDTDADSVNDESDKCPEIAGSLKYQGCPVPDTDGDKINDEEDACPDQAGTVEFNGCPIPDRDGDGLNDQVDRCPDTSGTAENNGCPALQQKIVETVNYAARNIFFAFSSDKLVGESFEALGTVAEILKSNSTLQLDIEGHTDNSGTVSYNLKLSQLRADAVKKYLIGMGIAENRLTSTGYGSKKPVEDNRTAKGKSRNRRVELKLKHS